MAIQLTTYEDVKIQQNHYIEDIESYLMQRVSVYINEQTILSKDFDSDEEAFTIKATCNGDITDSNAINYAKLKDVTTGEIRYYFVTSVKRLSESVWQLALTLDVVNSYNSYVLNVNSFKQVSIKRRHKDRWKLNSTTSKYERVFDKVDEGLDKVTSIVESKTNINSADCYLVSRDIPSIEATNFYNYSSQLFSQIYDNAGTNYYYINRNLWSYTFDSSMSVNEWKSYLIRSNDHLPLRFNMYGYDIIGDMINIYIQRYAYLTTIYYNVKIGIYSQDGESFTCLNVFEFNTMGKEVPSIYCYCEGLGAFKVYQDCACIPQVDSVAWSWSDLLGSGSLLKDSQIIPTRTQIPSIDSINKSDSSIKTIINIPVEIDSSNLVLFNGYASAVFNRTITYSKNIDVSATNVLSKINKVVRERDINFESKLYGSYIRDHYIAYDNFKLPVQPEYSDLSSLGFKIVIPNDMTTNLMIESTKTKETGYNSNKLLCSRNNNLSIFTNAYLDYIRNGYNYDDKNKTMSNISNWVNFGSNIIGTGVGAYKAKGNAFMGANVVSMGVNAVTSLGSSIMSSIQNEQSLANKRNQILNSSVSMSGSDNVLLFKNMNDGLNVIQYVVEAPNEALLNSIYNLFYFTGYADNLYYEVMPKIKTRAYFNYIQADIYQCSIANSRVRNRILAAYGAGITFEWKYNNTHLMEGSLYENWEESI